ncbi:LRR receptor-like serine/threonine-protein kinase ERECTA [Hevea brasiliensis]|uniref:LRR receptor-like serine/threonine-protein kinase ERECTA n=1 Tax=Hevea brasiliensis TaxID=3981 RepID=UPI0025FAF7AC|nr:LRR receptor-like serine/threonine-protein kinase ERECTA [Hevea brasiliensis]
MNLHNPHPPNAGKMDLHNPHPPNVGKMDLQNPLPSDSSASDRYGFWNLSGELRPSLTALKSLRYLDLSFNTFSGIPIPSFFDSWQNLQYLNLSNAGFSGVLQYLDVTDYDLHVLSAENLDWATGLVSLKYLAMSGVNLSVIRSNWVGQLNKLPHLTELHLCSCLLTGSISSPISVNFTSLAVVDLSFNRFNSRFPAWLANISSLVSIDVSFSGLNVGRFPHVFSELPNLRFLKLVNTFNKAHWKDSKFNWQTLQPEISFLELSSLKNLAVLDLEYNSLRPILPLGNLKKLVVLWLSENELNGTLPDSLQHFSELYLLDVSNNHLTGIISEAHFSELSKLKTLDLSGNSFIFNVTSFWIPPFQLESLYISSCFPNCSFPVWLKSQSDIIYLHFSNASTSGIVPDCFWTMSANLKDLNASSTNYKFQTFTKTLSILTGVDLSRNNLDGKIPEELMKLAGLMVLNLSGNHFTGQIPESVSKLKQLLSLDLSSSKLSCPIPPSISSLSFLGYLNLSNNNLPGKIPYKGQITTFDPPSFTGNPALCGAPLDVNCTAPTRITKRGDLIRMTVTMASLTSGFT